MRDEQIKNIYMRPLSDTRMYYDYQEFFLTGTRLITGLLNPILFWSVYQNKKINWKGRFVQLLIEKKKRKEIKGSKKRAILLYHNKLLLI